jgi:hypothetical protein
MTKLRLTDWASIAEVVGAFAVVLSLVYVGMQVRDNTAEVRAANRQHLVRRAHTATIGIGTSPELATAFAKVASSETLTPREHVQYRYFVRAVIYDVQEAYLLHQEARLDEEYWRTRSALFDAFMAQEVALSIYRSDKDLGLLHKDFVTWADNSLKKNL